MLLVSDLDGTLIAPVPADRDVVEALARFRSLVAGNTGIVLAYATGRDYALALQGVRTSDLPMPDVILSDVGTRILHRAGNAGVYKDDTAYSARLESVFGPGERARVEALVDSIPGIRLQDPASQGPFKVSFHSEPDLDDETVLSRVGSRLDVDRDSIKVVFSRDPVDSTGLLDILPKEVSKASATRYLSDRLGLPPERVLYFGDSGNDTDALLGGFRAVLVGNASDQFRTFLKECAVRAGIEDRLYFARSPYAAGVIEGCCHFGVL